MDYAVTLDPELRPSLEAFTAEMIAAIGADPPRARQLFAARRAQPPPVPGVHVEEREIATPDGAVPIVIYQPAVPAPRPALLWFHGGCYVFGTARDDEHGNAFAARAGCTVVSVGYRLAPEFTYRESVADAFAALCWLADHAEELGIDPERIAIGGASAGGGLAAGLALYNRDHGGPPLAFQLLIYPMLDDTHDTPSGHEVADPRVWHRAVSLQAWRLYLGAEYGSDRVSPYAAAARATDFGGLPPAFVTVGARDLFRDEAIDYAQRLMAAGVPTGLAVYPGMNHLGELLAPQAAVSQRMRGDYLAALRRGLARSRSRV